MTHEEMSDMYELYALGVLSADEKLEIDQHLAQGCADCGAGVKQAIAVNAMFLTLPEQVKPPRRLRRRVLASIAADSSPRRWIVGWAVAACNFAKQCCKSREAACCAAGTCGSHFCIAFTSGMSTL